MNQQFMWKGLPIKDIYAWARERGEEMVVYQLTMIETNPKGGDPIITTRDGVMPDYFWNNLHIPQLPGCKYFYKSIRKYRP